ncbi:MAG: hypothetical protein PWQ57_1227 [Desulfovibrionales bacterium]|jgi:hypothetical protein|nr:hypothetical protein [Desulfovibrionales bacterium]
MTQEKEFDILEMPLEGLAAYWLSVKKLLDSKKNRNVLAEEAAHTREPFIHHLLTATLSRLSEVRVVRLAKGRQESLLKDYERKLALMRETLASMSKGEHTRVSYVRMLSHYPTAPIAEKLAFDMVQAMMDSLADEAADKAAILNVDHKFKPEQLMVKLLFYASRARHGDFKALEPYLRYVNSAYFTEGLTMLLDGFDTGFVEHRLKTLGENILFETHLKMEMALEMCLGIKAKLTYDEVFTIAKAYL